MTATIVNGAQFSGVEIGNASLAEGGYFINYGEDIPPLLRTGYPSALSALVGVKYSSHPSGGTSGTRKPTEYRRLTLLIEGGPWRQRVWHADSAGGIVEVRLEAPGDFVAWAPGLWHQWWPEGEATMLTINFGERAA